MSESAIANCDGTPSQWSRQAILNGALAHPFAPPGGLPMASVRSRSFRQAARTRHKHVHNLAACLVSGGWI